MPTFETLPRFERDWKNLTAHQRATFGKVIREAFVPDLIVLTAPSGRACVGKASPRTLAWSR